LIKSKIHETSILPDNRISSLSTFPFCLHYDFSDYGIGYDFNIAHFLNHSFHLIILIIVQDCFPFVSSAYV